mmetsp:Transcript_27526/g.68931  ORF Transcript_27526/g.68931 Transcript_27526/m.68931 type:complete len:127 (-) Transcript_27526:20-400(-)
MRQNRSPSLEVQITSRRCTFIQVSQLTKWPLYVSPFFSSTNMGWPWEVFRRESGNMVGAFLSLGFATEEVEECREQTPRGKSDLIWVSVRSEARSWRVARLTPPRLRARDQAGVCELGGGWKVEWS